MAVTVTANTALSGANTKVWDIIATADADVGSGDIAHGFGEIPSIIQLIPTLPEGILKGWYLDLANTDATNIVLIGQNVMSSGDAQIQLRLVASRVHSMVA
jgi:hypothetical protein